MTYYSETLFPTQLPSKRLIDISKVLPFTLQQNFDPFACSLSKDPLKQGFLEIYLTILFGGVICRNILAMRVILFWQMVEI